MTCPHSALRGEGRGRKYPNCADKQYIKFGQKGRGVKKSQTFADVIYGSPLIKAAGFTECVRYGILPKSLSTYALNDLVTSYIYFRNTRDSLLTLSAKMGKIIERRLRETRA